MSIQIDCSECGAGLEITDVGHGPLIRVKPCPTCIDSAARKALEDAEPEDQEAISHDPALFHPDGSPKSVEEACEPEKGD